MGIIFRGYEQPAVNAIANSSCVQIFVGLSFAVMLAHVNYIVPNEKFCVYGINFHVLQRADSIYFITMYIHVHQVHTTNIRDL